MRDPKSPDPKSARGGGPRLVREPWSHPFRVAELAARKPTRFTLEPAAEARAALAAALGISAIPALSFKGELRPVGRDDWVLSADLSARVVQPCVVTLVPVETEIREAVARRFIAGMEEPEGSEIEMPEDDTAEPLPAVIDAGAVMAEEVSLALPAWPRAPGAELGAVEGTPPGAEPIVEEKLRPFAGLGALMAGRDPAAEPGSAGDAPDGAETGEEE